MMTGLKKYLVKTRAMAIDMETATIFTVGFANEIPSGALLLVSDPADDQYRNKNSGE